MFVHISNHKKQFRVFLGEHVSSGYEQFSFYRLKRSISELLIEFMNAFLEQQSAVFVV